MRKGHPIEQDLRRQMYFAAENIGVSNRPSEVGTEDILFQQQGFARHSSVHSENYYAAKVILIESGF